MPVRRERLHARQGDAWRLSQVSYLPRGRWATCAFARGSSPGRRGRRPTELIQPRGAVGVAQCMERGLGTGVHPFGPELQLPSPAVLVGVPAKRIQVFLRDRRVTLHGAFWPWSYWASGSCDGVAQRGRMRLADPRHLVVTGSLGFPPRVAEPCLRGSAAVCLGDAQGFVRIKHSPAKRLAEPGIGDLGISGMCANAHGLTPETRKARAMAGLSGGCGLLKAAIRSGAGNRGCRAATCSPARPARRRARN